MKSFTTLAFAASLALTGAQVTSNPDGTFTCAIPNAAYCVGDSLSTNIIIRCIGTVGHPGNCNDNLSGEFPQGVNSAPCWQPSATSGQAACSKNCIVYGGSGNYNGTFTLPNCTPSTTSSASVTATSSTSAGSNGTAATTSSTSASAVVPTTISYTTIVNAYTTVTVPCVSGTPIYSFIPPTTTVSPTIITLTTGGSGPSSSAPGPISNGTVTTSANNGGSATATPVGPTTTSPASFTGSAAANQAGGVLAVAGLLVAYFL